VGGDRLRPDLPAAHNNLGTALAAQGKLAEAVAAYREAIRLKPNLPEAHTNLGNALAAQGSLSEALPAYREAARLKPGNHLAHYNLGLALAALGEVAEAAAAYREVVRLKPDFPEAHNNLGKALADQGRFGEALASLRRGHELGSRRPGWPAARVAAGIRILERLVTLDRDLPAFLSGRRQPSGPWEQLELASLCRHPAKRLVAASARFYAGALAEPKLPGDLRRQHHYDAACSALLAGSGKGADAGRLDDRERCRWRRQGLTWLRADLALYADLASGKDNKARVAVRQRLAWWRQDPDLAPVRDKGRLARLPDSERAQWRRLWDDVAALQSKAQGEK
jgi:lipoprotein NlpI